MEKKQLEEAEQGGFVDDANIDWNNLDNQIADKKSSIRTKEIELTRLG